MQNITEPFFELLGRKTWLRKTNIKNQEYLGLLFSGSRERGEGGIGTSEKLILEGKPEEIDRGRRGLERNWS